MERSAGLDSILIFKYAVIIAIPKYNIRHKTYSTPSVYECLLVCCCMSVDISCADYEKWILHWALFSWCNHVVARTRFAESWTFFCLCIHLAIFLVPNRKHLTGKNNYSCTFVRRFSPNANWFGHVFFIWDWEKITYHAVRNWAGTREANREWLLLTDLNTAPLSFLWS